MGRALALRDEVKMASYRQRRDVVKARHFDEEFEHVPIKAAWVRYRVLDSTAYTTGTRLAHFDRELRRASSVVNLAWSHQGLPGPVSTSRGGLDIVAARSGSVDLLLLAGGAVVDALLTKPVQVMLATQQLIENGARLRAWLRTRRSSSDARNLPQPVDPDQMAFGDVKRIWRSMEDFLSQQQPSTSGASQPPPRGSYSDSTPRTHDQHVDRGASTSTSPDLDLIIEGRQPTARHHATVLLLHDDGTYSAIAIDE